jgi:hypothetical protein
MGNTLESARAAWDAWRVAVKERDRWVGRLLRAARKVDKLHAAVRRREKMVRVGFAEAVKMERKAKLAAACGQAKASHE